MATPLGNTSTSSLMGQQALSEKQVKKASSKPVVADETPKAKVTIHVSEDSTSLASIAKNTEQNVSELPSQDNSSKKANLKGLVNPLGAVAVASSLPVVGAATTSTALSSLSLTGVAASTIAATGVVGGMIGAASTAIGNKLGEKFGFKNGGSIGGAAGVAITAASATAIGATLPVTIIGGAGAAIGAGLYSYISGKKDVASSKAQTPVVNSSVVSDASVIKGKAKSSIVADTPISKGKVAPAVVANASVSKKGKEKVSSDVVADVPVIKGENISASSLSSTHPASSLSSSSSYSASSSSSNIVDIREAVNQFIMERPDLSTFRRFSDEFKTYLNQNRLNIPASQDKNLYGIYKELLKAEEGKAASSASSSSSSSSSSFSSAPVVAPSGPATFDREKDIGGRKLSFPTPSQVKYFKGENGSVNPIESFISTNTGVDGNISFARRQGSIKSKAFDAVGTRIDFQAPQTSGKYDGYANIQIQQGANSYCKILAQPEVGFTPAEIEQAFDEALQAAQTMEIPEAKGKGKPKPDAKPVHAPYYVVLEKK